LSIFSSETKNFLIPDVNSAKNNAMRNSNFEIGLSSSLSKKIIEESNDARSISFAQS
jgi:hypothetical protein